MFVYLDNSATTKQYDEVTEEMVRIMNADFGNPSSLHGMGLSVGKMVDNARSRVAATLNVVPEEICFTGSGTEADNLAIFGVFEARKRVGNKIIVSKGEHPAVIEACKRLERCGADVVYVNIDSLGIPIIEEVEGNLDDSTILVSIMAVNNELGTVAPIDKIGKLVDLKKNAVFHTDAIQAYGKIPIDIVGSNIDLLTVSSHKIHGPKGVGALYIKKSIRVEPHIYGGGQERKLRSGTENTPGIAGFAKAAEIADSNFSERVILMANARKYLLEGIKAEISDIRVNSPETMFTGEEKKGHGVNDLGKSPLSSPGILNVSFLGCLGEVLMRFLDRNNIFVSTTAACSSGKGGSKVLRAAGLDESVIDSAIRFSFSEFNTIEQMDYVLVKLKETVTSMRRLTKRGRS